MTTETINAIGKWVGSALVLGGVFALVWVGKTDAQIFIGMAGAVLGAGAYHVGITANPAPKSAPVPAITAAPAA